MAFQAFSAGGPLQCDEAAFASDNSTFCDPFPDQHMLPATLAQFENKLRETLCELEAGPWDPTFFLT